MSPGYGFIQSRRERADPRLTVLRWWAKPTDREKRAWAWYERRRELLGKGRRSELPAVAEALGVSVRTLERWEFNGAPRWYELALIGLSVARPRDGAS